MALIDSMVAYYDIEDATDSHSTLDLTTVGTFSYSAALNGNGAAFNTVDDRLTYAGNMSLDWTADYSWSWFTYKPTGTTWNNYHMDHNTTTNGNRRVLFTWGTNSCIIYTGGFTGGNTMTVGSLSLDTWYHWVLVKTGSNWELFKNDVSVATSTSGTSTYTNNKFAIGGSIDPDAGSICTIDMVGLWNKALSSAEITELYNSGAGMSYADITGGGGGATFIPKVSVF